MRTLLLGLLFATACSGTSAFPDAQNEAAGLRACFQSIPPLPVADKGKKLAPCAEQDGPKLIAHLEALVPSDRQAECHADALAGARQAVGAMQDLIRIYHRAGGDYMGVAAARNVDNGLTTLQRALAACASR